MYFTTYKKKKRNDNNKGFEGENLSMSLGWLNLLFLLFSTSEGNSYTAIWPSSPEPLEENSCVLGISGQVGLWVCIWHENSIFLTSQFNLGEGTSLKCLNRKEKLPTLLFSLATASRCNLTLPLSFSFSFSKNTYLLLNPAEKELCLLSQIGTNCTPPGLMGSAMIKDSGLPWTCGWMGAPCGFKGQARFGTWIWIAFLNDRTRDSCI